MRKKLLILAAALLVSSASVFAEWVYLGTGSDVTCEIDNSKIRKKADGIIVWVKFTYINENAKIAVKNSEGLSSLPEYYVLQTKYDTDNDRAKYLCQKFYDKNGNCIKTITPDDPAWDTIAPNTLGQLAIDYLIQNQ